MISGPVVSTGGSGGGGTSTAAHFSSQHGSGSLSRQADSSVLPWSCVTPPPGHGVHTPGRLLSCVRAVSGHL